MRSLALGLVVAAATPAFAGVPDKGDGTIMVLGGFRLVPGGDYASETGSSHSLVQPGFLAGLGYQIDDDLHVDIQGGYLPDHYRSGSGELKIVSVPILLALDTALLKDSWYTLYGAGGLGYSLNTSTRGGKNVEANSTAGFLALGMRMRLTDHLAFVVEERYTISSAQLDPAARSSINVGGNLLSIGLQIHFFSSDEKAPGSD
ncbi:MAG: outer membrane beta-barrel protein [Myxococcales bacterium]